MVPERARRRSVGLVAAVALVLLPGCYPGEIEGIGEPDVVLTVFDPTAAFGSFSTYAMPDTIIRVDALGSALPPNPVLDQQVLDAVATELTALGFTRVDATSPTAPDVSVVLSVNVEELAYWRADAWWSYWGWYAGWASWYPSWDATWAPSIWSTNAPVRPETT